MLSIDPPIIVPKIWPACWNVELTDIIEALKPGTCSRIRLKKAADPKAAKNVKTAQRATENERFGINVHKIFKTPETKAPIIVSFFLPNRFTVIAANTAPKMPPTEEIEAKLPPVEEDTE